jgi:hypothetical protein
MRVLPYEFEASVGGDLDGSAVGVGDARHPAVVGIRTGSQSIFSGPIASRGSIKNQKTEWAFHPLLKIPSSRNSDLEVFV